MARPLERAPRPVTSRNVSFGSFTPVMTQISSRDSPRLCTCLPRCREGRGIVNDPFAWLPLNDSGKYVSSSSQPQPRSILNEGE